MQKLPIIKNLREGRARLTELGIDPGYMSMKEMQVTLQQEWKRRASAAKLPVAAVAPKAAIPTIGDLKAAIAKERSVSAKIDMLESLRSNLLTAVKTAGTDWVKSAEVQRELQRVEKAAAYARLSESIADPRAARARRALELSNLE